MAVFLMIIRFALIMIYVDAMKTNDSDVTNAAY